ncbi:hypothetical protein [Clostridium sp. LP20]|uniref:hypothetical protein n=1 Tax=Clostridium sp. LP20 TaxID=3418665 RepID=UPI003EE44B93
MYTGITITNRQEEAIEKVTNFMQNKGMVNKEDYDIYFVEYSKLDKSIINVVVKVQFKEDLNIIKSLEDIGWVIEARYKNDNGSPSKFCNGEFNDSFGDSGDYNMIRMII